MERVSLGASWNGAMISPLVLDIYIYFHILRVDHAPARGGSFLSGQMITCSLTSLYSVEKHCTPILGFKTNTCVHPLQLVILFLISLVRSLASYCSLISPTLSSDPFLLFYFLQLIQDMYFNENLEVGAFRERMFVVAQSIFLAPLTCQVYGLIFLWLSFDFCTQEDCRQNSIHYPFVSWGAFRGFHFVVIVNRIVMNMAEQVSME